MAEEHTLSNSADSHHRLINPFLLPTHTEQGFLILIVGALVFLVQISFQESHIAERHFYSLAKHVIEAMASSQGNYSAGDYSAAVPDSKAFVWDLIGWALIIIFVTIANYYIQTWKSRLPDLLKLPVLLRFRKLRSKWTQSGAKVSDPKLDEELRLLSRRADIDTPALEIGDKWNLRTAQVFGFASFVIRLQSGFRILHRSKPDEARAILLHELAHIRNGDVQRGWIAGAVVYGTVGATIGSCFFKLIGLSSLLEEADLGPEEYVAAIATGVLLLFFYSRFLRAREVYADYRVRTWGAGDALYAVLSEVHSATASRRSPLPWQTNGPGLFSFHPSAATRLSYLLHPGLFFDTPNVDMFGLGLLMGIAIAGVALVSMPVIVLLVTAAGTHHGRVLVVFLFLIVDLLLSYSLVVTVGTAVQRQALAVLGFNKKRTGRKNLGVALSLSIGIYVGMELDHLTVETINPVRVLGWLTLSTFLLWLVLAFLQSASKYAFKRAVSEKVLRFRAHLVNLFATLLVTTLLPVLVLLNSGALTKSSAEVTGILIVLLGAFFMALYWALWIVVGCLNVLIWRRVKARCPNCYAESAGAIFASTCNSCNTDLTSWATTEALQQQRDTYRVSSGDQSEVEASDMREEEELRSFSEFETELVDVFEGQSISVDNLCMMLSATRSRRECLDALQFLERVRAVDVDPERRHRESPTIPGAAMIYFTRGRG